MTAPTSFSLGPRVKYAREQAGLTQDALATTLGFKDRQTISDIENDKRAVKADELLALGDALNRDLEFFVDPFNTIAEARYAWRAMPEVSDNALDQFQETANGWLGMLRWLHQQDPGKEPDLGMLALRINSHSTPEQVQRFGESLGRLLGLDLVPAAALPRRVADRLGISVLFVDGPSAPSPAISGAACKVGGVAAILVNRQESAGRRSMTLALALFHALTWKAMLPGWRAPLAAPSSLKPGKQLRNIPQVDLLAHAFATALLMPQASLDYLIEPARATDVGHLADMARELQVTPDALGRRLFELGRIDEATRARLSEVPQPDDQPVPNLFSLPFVDQLHVALDKGRLSARKAARTLGLRLPELTALFEACGLRAPFDL
jgi:transcriptional regulator with XRE-family HTH domain